MKISMPETVELRIEEDMSEFNDYRIEGVIKAANKKAVGEAFNHFLYQWQGTGTIVTNPDPTGMSLYKVEEVEGLRQENKNLADVIQRKIDSEEHQFEYTKAIAAQLEQKEKELSNLNESYDLLSKKAEEWKVDADAFNEMVELKKERLKENTRWKTFIKWVKEKVRNR